MLYATLKNNKHLTAWVGQKTIRITDALNAIMIQADGHELDHILCEIPHMIPRSRLSVQRFYGEDAVKALMTFVDFNTEEAE